MAHVARIDENNIVREVHVLNNCDLDSTICVGPGPNGFHEDCGNLDFSSSIEAAANAFQHALGLQGVWKLTSYNGNFRGTYAGIGYTYNAELDEFVPPAAPEIEAPIES